MNAFKRHTGLVAPLDRPNVDTDQIIPKQFLKRIERTGFGQFVFYDWRYLPDGNADPSFVLNEPRYDGASILVTDKNFGCGSSREHAPQALMRWGIRAIVGGSYGEIFFGNCVMLGIPCLRASQEDIEWLQREIGRSPQSPLTVDVEKQEVRFGDRVIKAAMPDGPRNQLVNGTWDSTAVLLEAGGAIEAAAGRLPYVKGF
jgi:3-isopropylmalate/(R)-2-methylmalate dehydratase small subunit